MAFKMFHTVLFASFFLMLVCNATAKPRDATAQIQRNELEEINREDKLKDPSGLLAPRANEVVTNSPELLSTTKLQVENHGYLQRIPCDYEEVTEDPVCAEHCLPKGYSYGVCVMNFCSCI